MGMMAKKCRVSFEDDENVLKLIMGMEEKLCENTKSHELYNYK